MGGTSSQKTEIPQYIEDAGRAGLRRAMELQELGVLPYMGGEVATINPYEQAMASNVGSMSSAYGLEAPATMSMAGVPVATQGGLSGYTSYPAYIESMELLRQSRPDQYAELSNMTRYDPITGMVNPDFESNLPIFDAPVLPVRAGGSGGDDNMPFPTFPSATPRPSGPVRPRSRAQGGGGGGLLSDIRSGISDAIYSGLGGRG